MQLRILKDLRTDNFGQNRAKHGVCLELRILKELAESTADSSKLTAPDERGNPSGTREVIGDS